MNKKIKKLIKISASFVIFLILGVMMIETLKISFNIDESNNITKDLPEEFKIGDKIK